MNDHDPFSLERIIVGSAKLLLEIKLRDYCMFSDSIFQVITLEEAVGFWYPFAGLDQSVRHSSWG
jgi:hypothetical protein